MIRRIAVAVALTLTPAVFGQTYIVADGDCGPVTLHAAGGTSFPSLGEPIGADRVQQAYVFLPKHRVAVNPAAGHSLDFNATVPDDVVVMASADLAPQIVGDETRTEHAKALVFCAAVAPAADWQRSTGLGLEIYPQGWNGPRPHMKSGDTMRFIAVDKATNQWLRDLPMELYRAGAGRIATGVQDAHGGMDFRYPEPGLYMVTTTYRRADPELPDHWLVDTSTLTFEIK